MVEGSVDLRGLTAEQVAAVVGLIPLPAYVTDGAGRLDAVNAALLDVLGLDRGALLADPAAHLSLDEESGEVCAIDPAGRALRTRRSTVLRPADGTSLAVQVDSGWLRDDAGGCVAVLHVLTPDPAAGSALQKSYEALRAAYADVRNTRRQLRNALDAAAEGFAIYRAERDATGAVRSLVLTYVNEHGAAILGGTTLRLQDYDLRELVHGEDAEQLWTAALEVLQTGEPAEVAVGLSVGSRPVAGEFAHVVSRLSSDELVIAFRDVTDELQHQEALEYAATHDSLTGLPNRTLLQDRIEQALVQRQERGEALAVAFLDLDRFKEVNDRFGHDAGDHYLQQAATRIRASLREADTLARLGGDEFVAVLRDVHDEASVRTWYVRLRRALAEPVDLGPEWMPVQASVGVAVAPYVADPPIEPDLLLRAADQAMYAAKQAGRGRLEVVTVPAGGRSTS